MTQTEHEKAMEVFDRECAIIKPGHERNIAKHYWLAAWEARGRASGQQVGEDMLGFIASIASRSCKCPYTHVASCDTCRAKALLAAAPQISAPAEETPRHKCGVTGCFNCDPPEGA